MFVIVLTLHLFQRVRKKLSSILTIFSSPGMNVLGEVLSYPQRHRRRRRCRRRQVQVKVFVF